MSNRSEIHDRVLKARSLKDLEDGYRDWARDYDADLVENAGYVAPKQCADTLSDMMASRNERILDAGCGTGLVGQYLAESGFRAIDGLDYSPDMLEQAAAKGCYSDLMRADLNQALNIPDNQYSATACVGTFTSGHVAPQALHELVRVTSPEGAVCFTVRDSFWEESGFVSVIDDLTIQGAVELVSRVEVPYVLSEGSHCHQVVLQVL
ncbi:MAG: class I SAM-dependent methyltransferase [Halieaceae bacterium]|jgi:ubiquinone/menaquinone biosynthesis C-methylase UbiE|nr:class I SAM-dependent methyltransferase [Halieaceae bacterium]